MTGGIAFPSDLEQSAHRSGTEYAWRRADAKRAARHLADFSHAILGGELWLVHGTEIWGVVPQRVGPPGVYHWAVERGASEPWPSYVARSCSETLAAIDALPPEGEAEISPGADIFYNLTWTNEQQ